jgi:hypothetical protein
MLSTQNRNLSDKLIRIIESDAEELTQATVKKLQSSPLTRAYHDLSFGDVYSRVYAVYHELGLWLWEKSGETVQRWYNGLGADRCEEGIPLVEVLWALVFTKDGLLEYLAAQGVADSAMELYQRQEFHNVVGHFFDRAMCYTAEGYAQRTALRSGGSSATAVH